MGWFSFYFLRTDENMQTAPTQLTSLWCPSGVPFRLSHLSCKYTSWLFVSMLNAFSEKLCSDHWGRLSYLSLLFFGTLHSSVYIFSFLLYLSPLFFSQLLIRPPQTTSLPFFFLGMVLIPVSCTMSWTSIHSSTGTLSDLIPWIYLVTSVYNHKILCR